MARVIAALVAYIGTIPLANWALDTYGFVPVGFGLQAAAGVYFAGLALGLRDLVHEWGGRKLVVAGILIGGGVSFAIAPAFAAASMTAFLVSELIDFGVYTPIRERSKPLALVASNTVGATVDSVLFLFIAFGTVAGTGGQIVGKTWATLSAVLAFFAYRAFTRYYSQRRL